jgi:hypothetical protein
MRPLVLPKSGTAIWHVQQAYTVIFQIIPTAVLRITFSQKQRGG